MRKGLIALAAALGIGLGGYALAGWWSPGYGGWGPMMGPGGGYMMGRGWGGPMMGPGWGGQMMGPGYGRGGNYGYCGYGPGAPAQQGQALTEQDAQRIARNYIGRNPNLKVGKIEEKDDRFEAEILTKEDSLVTRLGIDKQTGWSQPVY